MIGQSGELPRRLRLAGSAITSGARPTNGLHHRRMTRAPFGPSIACYLGNSVGQERRTFCLPGGTFRPRREELMKAIHSMVAALGLAVVLPAPTNAATADPEVIIYRFPGVLDDGSAGQTGVATSFHCTNFSG